MVSAVAELLVNNSQKNDKYQKPQTALEKRIHNIFLEVFNLSSSSNIDITKSFNELRISSVEMMKLLTKLRHSLYSKIDLDFLLSNPSIHELSLTLEPLIGIDNAVKLHREANECGQRPTPSLVTELLLCGAQIGSNVHIYTTDINTPDLLIVYDNIYIDSEVMLNNFSYNHTIFELNVIQIDSNCAISVRSVLHHRVHLKQNVLIKSMSSVTGTVEMNTIINGDQKQQQDNDDFQLLQDKLKFMSFSLSFAQCNDCIMGTYCTIQVSSNIPEHTIIGTMTRVDPKTTVATTRTANSVIILGLPGKEMPLEFRFDLRFCLWNDHGASASEFLMGTQFLVYFLRGIGASIPVGDHVRISSKASIQKGEKPAKDRPVFKKFRERKKTAKTLGGLDAFISKSK
ncbi:unnamed protein product [Didymodactylos carnosus]|uniref:Carrier domain-containing protein n=1 Tax=Didymodactylos carnosus TaxID=1234261 RepID=A0A814UEJ2_9BILA|nr:unnamed protein product [Didymodactylos carnosus]CAF3939686.1 unnamed protein product [Didymodactylos carnosus]